MSESARRDFGRVAFESFSARYPRLTAATFFYPSDDFSFADMYAALKREGYVIYPGKLTERPSFRLGNIGEIYAEDVEAILELFSKYAASRRA